jgi:hypothetical protein
LGRHNATSTGWLDQRTAGRWYSDRSDAIKWRAAELGQLCGCKRRRGSRAQFNGLAIRLWSFGCLTKESAAKSVVARLSISFESDAMGGADRQIDFAWKQGSAIT